MKTYSLIINMSLALALSTVARADLLVSPEYDLPAAVPPPPLPDKNALTQWGFANKATSVDEPMRIVVSEKDPANPSKLIERDVAVTDIPRYERPTQMQGETPRAFFQRVVAAQEAHSKLKAERVAAAINTTLGANRATPTQSNKLSSTGSTAWNVLVPGDNQVTPIKNGQIDVTGAHKLIYGPSAALIKVRNDDIRDAKAHNKKPENINNQIPVPKPLTNNHTGELGDGVQIKNGNPPPPPGGSPGSRGSLQTMNFDLVLEFPGEFPGLPMTATGFDAEGNSSVIQFGILDRYVASLIPFVGQSDEQIYLGLKALLDMNGLPSTYDSLSRTLSLDEEFGDNDTLYWAATDTGLSDYLSVSYGAFDAQPVPEPSTAVLLSMVLISLARFRRIRRKL